MNRILLLVYSFTTLVELILLQLKKGQKPLLKNPVLLVGFYMCNQIKTINMEKLHTIVTILLKGIVGSYAQPVLNPRGFYRNEFWNFSTLTATLAGTIRTKYTLLQPT